MKFAVLVSLLLFLFSVQPLCANEYEETKFLLSFIAESDCTFIRNGKEYSGKEASEHLYKKFNYVKKRINKTSDFIEKVASHSSITKKPYWVRCGNKKHLSGDWLTERLAAYKNSENK